MWPEDHYHGGSTKFFFQQALALDKSQLLNGAMHLSHFQAGTVILWGWLRASSTTVTFKIHITRYLSIYPAYASRIFSACLVILLIQTTYTNLITAFLSTKLPPTRTSADTVMPISGCDFFLHPNQHSYASKST